MTPETGDPAGRRRFLTSWWGWLKLAAGVLLCYPLWRFVRFHVPPKPRFIKVEKRLLAGDVHLDPEFALFVTAEKAWAVSRTCTHLGCRLNFSQEEKQFICPCHQSRFSPQGKRLDGPAQKDLPVFKVEPLGEGKGYMVTV
ncbi:MAG: ubiquinol-cytochrome c reductase iron-sulfur subunit [Desulfurivibrionaceae bacterium]|nr:ubiquinol-cytochrome c reductase iron-sulfur subunit [Desulfurivibrionaceae bacterium]